MTGAIKRPTYASLGELQLWAAGVMRREPDFIIGDNYLRRWWVIPRNEFCSVYLHEILHSDDDRALHDHPWANTSFVISGGYVEHTPEGRFERKAGDVIERPATALHRLEVAPGQSAVTLFQTGPRIREWGFQCPNGWVHWKDFTSPDDPSQVGRGCGEHEPTQGIEAGTGETREAGLDGDSHESPVPKGCAQ